MIPDKDLVLRPEGNHYWSPSSERFDDRCETDDGWVTCRRTVDVLDTPEAVRVPTKWKGRSVFVYVASRQGYAESQALELRFER